MLPVFSSRRHSSKLKGLIMSNISQLLGHAAAAPLDGALNKHMTPNTFPPRGPCRWRNCSPLWPQVELRLLQIHSRFFVKPV